MSKVGATSSHKPTIKKRQRDVDPRDAGFLDKLSIELSQAIGTPALYKKIVDAAVAIMDSHYATLQMLYPDPPSNGKLRIVASSGFSPEAEKYWEWVYHYTASSCGEVLRTRRRVIVPDYRTADFMQGELTLPVFIEGGVYAAQSTPLYADNGKFVGMVSTHWGAPHNPPQQHLDQLDILARLAANLIERTLDVEPLAEETI